MCSAWCGRRAFAPVLLAFVPHGKVFAALADTWFICVGGPVITPKSNTFGIDCASDGSRGMLCGDRRLYAFKPRWPRLLFYSQHVPVTSAEVKNVWIHGFASRVPHASSLKDCKRIVLVFFFYGCNCRPYAKSTFSPVLDCQTE